MCVPVYTQCLKYGGITTHLGSGKHNVGIFTFLLPSSNIVCICYVMCIHKKTGLTQNAHNIIYSDD